MVHLRNNFDTAEKYYSPLFEKENLRIFIRVDLHVRKK